MTDAAELNELRRRAYAPGAPLTDDEAARLHEWEEQRRRARMSPGLVVEPDGEDAAEESALDDLLGPSDESPSGAPTAFDTVRRQPTALILGGAVLLCLGAALGWLIPAIPGWQASILSAAETEGRGIVAELMGVEEDAVRLAARDEELRVWLAPRRDGAEMCVIVQEDDHQGMGCTAIDDYPRYGATAAVDVGSGEGREYVYVWVRDSVDGEPMVSVQRESIIGENSDSAWLDQFPEPYRASAQALVDAGYDNQSPMIVGFDGEAPVWTASRSSQTCLIVAGVNGGEVCAAHSQAHQSGLSFILFPDNPAEAETVRTYTLRWGSQWSTPTLTIESRSAQELHFFY